MSDIFLSYRRADEPGYVGRLADGLTEAFGEVVFRDVDSIGAGNKWKLVLQKQVSQAQILIAVIGRRWQSILAEREPDTDQVRFELNLAHMLEIPVIPLRMHDAPFSPDQELGNLNWLRALQFFELSDQQGRWKTDLDRLVTSIVGLTSLQRIKKPDDGQSQAGIRVGEGLAIRRSRVGDVTAIKADTAEAAKTPGDISVLHEGNIEDSELGDITGIKIEKRGSKDTET